MVVIVGHGEGVVCRSVDGSIMGVIRRASSVLGRVMLRRIMSSFGGGGDTQGPSRWILILVRGACGA